MAFPTDELLGAKAEVEEALATNATAAPTIDRLNIMVFLFIIFLLLQ